MDSISPVFMMILNGFIRYGLVGASSWFVTHKILTQDQGDSLISPSVITAVGVALVAFGSGMYVRLRSRLKTRIALGLPKGSTEQTVSNIVQDGSVKAVLTANPANL